ncbi:MAG: hypothetical protein ABSD74_07715 [Rhizomicrobium sp.]|jgi:hypothetical protein
MRTLLLTIVAIIVLAAGGLYAAYGQIDPCRALAVEQARRAESDSGLPVGGIVEPIRRAQSSQLSTGECARDLIRSWGERLSHRLH